MNIENIVRVADAIEHGTIKQLRFDMGQILIRDRGPEGDSPSCGSRGCIIGFAIAVKNGTFEPIDYPQAVAFEPENWRAHQRAIAAFYAKIEAVKREAAEFLGLLPDEANALFFPDDVGLPTESRFEDARALSSDVGPDWAARTLRHLAETGNVDWLETEAPQHGDQP